MFLYVVAVLRSGTLMDAVEMRCCVTSLFKQHGFHMKSHLSVSPGVI